MAACVCSTLGVAACGSAYRREQDALRTDYDTRQASLDDRYEADLEACGDDQDQRHEVIRGHMENTTALMTWYLTETTNLLDRAR